MYILVRHARTMLNCIEHFNEMHERNVYNQGMCLNEKESIDTPQVREKLVHAM